MILGDFKARCAFYWTNSITFCEGIESLTTINGFQQLISDPTLVVDNGIHPTFHANFQHQITYIKFSLMAEYPLACNWLVWDYRRANTDSIQSHTKIHQQIKILNNTLTNLFSNFILSLLLSMKRNHLRC